MCVLIGNIVKTQYADYPCATREEAEALFLRLRQREQEVEQRGRKPRTGAADEAAHPLSEARY